MSIDDKLHEFAITYDVSSRETRKRDIANFKSALLEIIIGEKPLRHCHTIALGHISHPHETNEDIARNEGLDEYEKKLTELFK